MKRLSVLLFFYFVFYNLFCQCNDCEICDNDCEIYKSSFNYVRKTFNINSTILVDMKISERTLKDRIDNLYWYCKGYGKLNLKPFILNDDSCSICNLSFFKDSVLCGNNIYQLGNNNYLECFLDSSFNVKIVKDAGDVYMDYIEKYEDEVNIAWIYFRNILYINSEYAFFTLYVVENKSMPHQMYFSLILHRKQNGWEVIRAIYDYTR